MPLWYIEPLSDVRTPLADFFSILLEEAGCAPVAGRVSYSNSVG